MPFSWFINFFFFFRIFVCLFSLLLSTVVVNRKYLVPYVIARALWAYRGRFQCFFFLLMFSLLFRSVQNDDKEKLPITLVNNRMEGERIRGGEGKNRKYGYIWSRSLGSRLLFRTLFVRLRFLIFIFHFIIRFRSCCCGCLRWSRCTVWVN